MGIPNRAMSYGNHQMHRIRNASDSASGFNLHDPLLEKTLPTSSHDECFTFSL
jgi:hypothetical protein